ncbi:MAG: tetratricopeptide repeat protein [Lentisphaeria bacterium]|nr:tetratricopeptide repeat protein [Lentisphaeria bacterium]
MRNSFLRSVASSFEGMPPILIPLFALLCGCCLRGWYLYELSLLPVGEMIVGPDVSEYYSHACRILAGEFLPESLPIHAPLYAYFLALLASFTSHQILEMRFLQSLIMMCLTVYPVYYSLRIIYFAPENMTTDRPWTMRFIPFISTWILALYPPLIVYQSDFFAENLLCVCLAFAVYFMLLADKTKLPGRFGYFAIAGSFCALAVLTHPSSMLFALFVFFYLLIRGILGRGLVSRNRKIFTAFAFIFPVLILTFFWSYHVSKVASRPVFIQGNSGFNFYLGNNKNATGACDIPPGKDWYRIHADNAKEAESRECNTDALFVKKALQESISHPVKTILRTIRKILYIFSASELSTWSDITALKKCFFHKYFFHFFFLFLSVSAAMVFLTRAFQRRFLHDMRYFILLGGSIFLAQILTVSAGRYRMALLPVLAAIASLLFAAPRRTFGKYLKAAFAFLLFLAMGIGGMVLDMKARGNDLKEYSRLLLAEAYLKKGEVRHCEEVLQQTPLYYHKFDAQKYDLLAKAKIARKDYAGGAAILEKALQQEPGDFALLMNYGTLLLETKKWDKAKEVFDRASLLPRSRSNTVLLLYNYGLLAQYTGNFAEAERRYYSVLQLDPLYAKALNNLGVLLIRSGGAVDAEIFLMRACAMDEKNEQYLLNLAVARKIAGKTGEMKKSCAKALLINPHSKAKILLQETEK